MAFRGYLGLITFWQSGAWTFWVGKIIFTKTWVPPPLKHLGHLSGEVKRHSSASFKKCVVKTRWGLGGWETAGSRWRYRRAELSAYTSINFQKSDETRGNLTSREGKTKCLFKNGYQKSIWECCVLEYWHVWAIHFLVSLCYHACLEHLIGNMHIMLLFIKSAPIYLCSLRLWWKIPFWNLRRELMGFRFPPTDDWASSGW